MLENQTRHLAAIMFTDVAGYTALMQRDEQKAREVRDRHRSVLTDTLGPHGGELLEHYGDGSLSIFTSAIQAVRCALEIQETLSGPSCGAPTDRDPYRRRYQRSCLSPRSVPTGGSLYFREGL